MIAPIDVTLTEAEIAEAVEEGTRRHADVVAKNYQNKHGCTDETAASDIDGALGELAFHKGLGLVWNKLAGAFGIPDARHNIQIRMAPCLAAKPPPGFGHLIHRPDDDPRDYYALVTGNPPYFRIEGWIYGEDARRSRWVRREAGRPAAWFVPSSALHRDFSRIIPQ